MKVFISADIEGIGGVVRGEQASSEAFQVFGVMADLAELVPHI
jgi:D-aminopeptidase